MGLLLDVLSDLVVFATIVMAIISLIQKSGKKNSNKKQPSHKKQKQQESVDYTEKLRTLWHNTEQNVMERRIEEKSINVEKKHNANSQKNRSQNKKEIGKNGSKRAREVVYDKTFSAVGRGYI